MKHGANKLLSAVLCVAMMLTLLALPVYAQEGEEHDHAHEEYAVTYPVSSVALTEAEETFLPAESAEGTPAGDLPAPEEAAPAGAAAEEPTDEADQSPVFTYEGGNQSDFDYFGDPYCSAPNVTVTAAEGLTVESVTVVQSRNVNSRTLTRTYQPKEPSRTFTIQGDELADFCVAYCSNAVFTAKDSDGNTATLTLNLGHPFFKGRQQKLWSQSCTTPEAEAMGYLCSSCNQYFYPSVTVNNSKPALKHDMQVVENLPCGGTVKKCSRCDYTEVTGGSHNWGEEQTQAPTCSADGKTTDGYVYRECQTCHTKETLRVIRATGHSVSSTVVNATCTEPGYRKYRCYNCGYEHEGNETPPLGHSYKIVSEIPATCTTDGKGIYGNCIRCGAEPDEEHQPIVIPALGHDYKKVTDTQPDCTTPGAGHYECSRCQEKGTEGDYAPYTIPATGHSFTKNGQINWVVLKEPTCAVPGERVQVCVTCGAYGEREEIPAVGDGAHTFVDDHDCTTRNKCSACGAEDPNDQVMAAHKLELASDGSAHWYVCTNDGCRHTEGRTAHQVAQWSGYAAYHKGKCEVCGYEVTVNHTAEHSKDDGDCTTPVCCPVCNYRFKGAAYGHSFQLVKSDGECHWLQCSNQGCQQIKDKEAHYGGDDGNCLTADRCSRCWVIYVQAQPSHNYGDAVPVAGGDYENHVRTCTNPHCTATVKEAHHGTDDDNCETGVTCEDCGFMYIPATSHEPGGIWLWDETAHYQYCTRENCKQTVRYEHIPVNDDGDCTTPIHCAFEFCEYIFTTGQTSHNWSEYKPTEDGKQHYRTCTNPNCSVVDTPADHTGGEATCVDRAKCTVCGVEYGTTDPSNHTGGTRVEGYRAPTEQGPGFTGVTYCAGCNAILDQGHEINPTGEHTWGSDWHYDNTHHWKECVTCGTHDPSTEKAHDFTDWTSDSLGRTRKCKVCGYEEFHAHTPEADDHDCSTPVKCSECGTILVEALEHSFVGRPVAGENGHYVVCKNEGCTVHLPPEEHTGGNATCHHQAICAVCAAFYGPLDPDNHEGGEVVLGYRDPTEDTTGYTGDIYCLGCWALKAKGQSLPIGEREHDWVLDYDGNYCWYECTRCLQRKPGSYHLHTFLQEDTGDDLVCAVCGMTNPYAGHTHVWGDYETKWDATCGLSGVKARTCEQCGAHLAVELTATGQHTWDAGTTVKAPTCVEKGEKSYICTVCGAVRTEELAATGAHTWNTGSTAKEPTCTESGEKIYTCMVCGLTRTELLPATGHKWAEKWASNATHHWHVCENENCPLSEERDLEGYAAHTYKDGKCTVCGAADPNYREETPKTGDILPLFLAAACLSAAGMAILLTQKKKWMYE